MSTHLVRGISLNDYFKLTDAEPFEDSAEFDCLVGDLITKPPQNQKIHHKIQQNQQKEQQYYQGNTNNYNTITEKIKQHKMPTLRIHQKETIAENKLSRLSSLELRSSPIRIYKYQKMRIRQSSNSPFQRKSSKHKQSRNHPLESQNLISTQLYFKQNRGTPMQTFQKYYRGITSTPPKQIQKTQKIINLRQIKHLKQMQKTEDLSKVKLDGVYSTVNAYAKKIREDQQARHKL